MDFLFDHQAIVGISILSDMQTAFLARDTAKELPGYDLYSKTERDRFIADTINMLFRGMKSTERLPVPLKVPCYFHKRKDEE